MSSPPNITPARRRNGRNNARSSTQKAYASENDAAVFAASHYHTTPQTPNKLSSVSPGHANAYIAQQTVPKPRNRNSKPKIKNLPTSPNSRQPNDYTPPQRSSSMKAVVGTAFAGATFHASPAPSALPIPSFLSKTSSESPVYKPERNAHEPSPPATDTDASTPLRPAFPPKQHESPLDFMFRAHREEKERLRQDYSVGGAQDTSGTTSLSSHQAVDLIGSPMGSNFTSQTRRSYTRQSFSGTDSFDLDPSRPMGPAFSTPYHDRIKAARNNLSYHAPGPVAQTCSPSLAPDDPTEALKKFLFGRNGSSDSTLPVSPPVPTSSALPGHTQPIRSNRMDLNGDYSRSSNIQAMENDLRRILKLEPTADSSATERRLFS